MNIDKILNNSILMVYLAPFSLGLLSVLSFQPYNFTFINFLIIPCLFLILSYVRKKSKNVYRKKPFLKNFFLIGYLFGIGFFLSNTYWISYSLTFDPNFKFLIPISLIFIPSFLGLFFGIATLISGPFIKNNFISILLFCSAFSFLDYVRSKILTGFPWNLWGYSWSWFTEVLQLVNPIGLFAFNLLSITIFCTPLLAIFKKKHNLTILLILVVLFFSNYIYGSLEINKNENINSYSQLTKENSINIKIIAPNFDLKYNLSDEDLQNQLDKLIKYSEPNADKQMVFIWPEGIFTGYNFSEIKKYKKNFQKGFSDNHVIIFGINTESDDGSLIFNSLVGVNSDLEIIYKYNKKKIVPFGEFLPFEVFLNKFGLKKITQGHGSFAKGSSQKNLLLQNARILPLICYEIIFPELIQNLNHNNLIVNISEDAWFGGSIGPHQHFSKAIFRSIENDTYLARSANQGVSAFISNKGKVIKRLEPYEAGNIELNVPLIDNNNKNKNDLIFFVLLFTYILIFFTLKNKLYD